MTATKPKLQAFEGAEVHRATVAIRKAGDGLSEGLAIEPDEVHQGEQRYYVLRAECKAVNFKTDDKGITTREHVMHAVAISPVEGFEAEKFLQEYATEVQRKKSEVDGQLLLDSELAATEREQQDADGDPAEIAQDAKKRVVDGG
jgi:hypothetical protein